jgi:cytochrome bd-type quinol oxidase subunit 2
VTAIFLPVILAYTAWIHGVMRGRTLASHIDEHGSY